MSNIQKFVKQNKEEFLDSFLIPWLKIPSISSDSSKKKDMLKACEFLQKELQNSGLETHQFCLEKGNPVVYAEKIVDENLPTILVYGHYDVQPIKQPELWKTQPFEPKKIKDRLYARGATDDKGQLAAHALAMRYFNQNDFPCNIKFVVEGNEEGGNSTFFDFIKRNGKLLACDAVLISDTGTLEEGYPALTTNLKGIVIAKMKTKTPKSLIDVIHSLHDPVKNKILLKRFYDKVIEQKIDPEILERFEKPSESMGDVVKPEEGYSQLHHRWHRPTSSPLFLCYANKTPIMKKGQKTIKIVAKGPKEALHSGRFGGPVQEPALNICHLLAGLKDKINYELDYMHYGSRILSTSIQPVGEAQITIKNKKSVGKVIEKILETYSFDNRLFDIENVADRKAYLKEGFNERFDDGNATAYLSFRLVPNQDPKKVYQSLIDLIKEKNQVEIEDLDCSPPFMTDTNNQYCKAVIEGLQKGYRKKSVHLIAEGGSIPIIHTLYNTLKAPVVLAGFSSPKDNLHAPNESILLEKGVFAGAKSVIYAFQKIGKLKN